MFVSGIKLAQLRRVGPEPWCRKCGYSAFAASGPRCPECGTLRVGSKLLRARDFMPWPLERVLGFASAPALWTAVVLVGVPLFEFLHERYQPAIHEVRSVWRLEWCCNKTNVRMLVGRAEWDDGTPPPLGLVLPRSNRSRHDHTPSPTALYADGRWPGSFGTGMPDADAIADWVRFNSGAANLPADAVNSPEAYEACAVAAACLAGQPPPSSSALTVSTSYVQHIRHPTWPKASAAVAVSTLILVWVVGSVAAIRTWSNRLYAEPPKVDALPMPDCAFAPACAPDRTARLASNLAALSEADSAG